MDNVKLREQEILRLKEELSTRYSYLMTILLLLFALIHLFIFKDNIMGYYSLGGAVCIFSFVYVLDTFFPSVTLKNRVQVYLIIAPLYVFFLTLYFWKISIVNFCWFIPIPLGAYVYLDKKYGFIYSIYAIFIAMVSFFTAHFLSLEPITISYEENYRYTDFLIFGSNILIVYLFIYYKDKIREQELLFVIEKREKIILPVKLEEQDNMPDAELLFERIENEMITKSHFINPKFSLSVLNTILETNNTYTSRAIRKKGYSNFNTYVNSHRINYVKELIEKSDLEKVTLMYIYTEAGFNNQSTFNKAFKQCMGMTPSEYIQRIKK